METPGAARWTHILLYPLYTDKIHKRVDNTFIDLIREFEDRPLALQIYNSKSQTLRGRKERESERRIIQRGDRWTRTWHLMIVMIFYF